MSLTFTLSYTPQNKTAQPGDIDFTCSDKKLHVRLSDYCKYQVIRGFDKKLQYLVSYLINFSTSDTLYYLGRENFKSIIKNFNAKDDVSFLCSQIQLSTGYKVRGIKVLPNYKKVGGVLLGKLDPKAFPVLYDKTRETYKGSLKVFLSILGISLDDYLFNDRYEIIIHEEISDSKINKKFINKQNKKYLNAIADYEKLW